MTLLKWSKIQWQLGYIEGLASIVKEPIGSALAEGVCELGRLIEELHPKEYGEARP